MKKACLIAVLLFFGISPLFSSTIPALWDLFYGHDLELRIFNEETGVEQVYPVELHFRDGDVAIYFNLMNHFMLAVEYEDGFFAFHEFDFDQYVQRSRGFSHYASIVLDPEKILMIPVQDRSRTYIIKISE